MTTNDSVSAVVPVCQGVEQVLKELRGASRTSPEQFFETVNLWRCEIQNTCTEVQEYYASVWYAPAHRRLLKAAAALFRSIHETSISLEYLNNPVGALGALVGMADHPLILLLRRSAAIRRVEFQDSSATKNRQADMRMGIRRTAAKACRSGVA